MPAVTHVSETALWIAALRARETARPDAIFRDPLAERLAGDRGRQIAARLSKPGRDDWPLIVRTRLIDDLIVDAVASGADRVLNLAAGLDTRPYRLPLPSTLRWIEADLPALIDEKERALEGEQPVCALARERVDLADAQARAAFLDRALEGARRAVVLTEGLLVYLDSGTVEAIARDLRARSQVAFWIIDLASPAIVRMMQRRIGAEMAGSAQLRFAPGDGVAFFERFGWKAPQVRSYFREAGRLGRLPGLMRLFRFVPDPDPRRPGNRPWAAAVRFEPAFTSP